MCGLGSGARAEMGAGSQELVRQPRSKRTLQQEETRLPPRRWSWGSSWLDESDVGPRRRGGTLAGGKTAFQALWTTVGFPYGLPEDALRARGLQSTGRASEQRDGGAERSRPAAWESARSRKSVAICGSELRL